MKRDRHGRVLTLDYAHSHSRHSRRWIALTAVMSVMVAGLQFLFGNSGFATTRTAGMISCPRPLTPSTQPASTQPTTQDSDDPQAIDPDNAARS